MNDFGRLCKLIIILLFQVSVRLRRQNFMICGFFLNKNNGWVLSDNCACMAGLGSACSHIAALLLKLETAVHLKLKDSAAPTSVLCSWKSCKKAVEPAPLQAVNFSVVKKRGLPGDNTKNVPHKITNYSTKNPSAGNFPLKNEDVQSLYKINPQIVFFHGNISP